jgi:hypothetical protein
MRYDAGSKIPIMFAADGYTLRDALKSFIPWRAHPDAVELCDRMTDEQIEVLPEHAATMLAVWLHARTCLIGRMTVTHSLSGDSGGDSGL